MKKIIFLLLLLSELVVAGSVHRIIVDGVINPVSTEYIIKSIERAQQERADLLVIELDTPGGLMESMHKIVKAIQSSVVPVAVYVSPAGSRAGSAGVFITYAAHVAAMAPSTNIGSAHPVFGAGSPGGKPDSTTSETLMEKVVNDAVAKIRAVAVARGRNADWAEKAIRESANIPAQEALKLNVIDYVVPTLDSLLQVLDGKTIKLDTGAAKTLHLKHAQIITFTMSWRQQLLDTITNPNIAYILMMLGILGLTLELYNPGAILPGIVGGISLILGLYAMETLSVNYAGILLILFAVILFLLEIKVPSFGMLTIGGVLSLIGGSVMLFDSNLPFLQISWQVIAAVVVTVTLFFVFAVGVAVRAQKKQPRTGREGMVGEQGVVFKSLNPVGTVKIHGEFWKAESEQPVKKGARVQVTEVESASLVLKVKPVK